MNLNSVDPHLEKILKDLPNVDIWADLPKAREVGAARLADEPPFNKAGLVVIQDNWVTERNGHPNIRVRIYSPAKKAQNLPALLWIHGGGYVVGSPESCDQFIVEMVATVPCIVVSVAYRLAPENPFPAPLEDCYDALIWMASHANKLGIDEHRIAIGGMSAGGGLAAALALLVRDRGEISVLFQMLLCPMIDDRNVTPSSHMNTGPGVWSRDSNLRGWAAYLGGNSGSAEVSHYAAASRATDLKQAPRAYIAVGSLDLFVDENIAYAQRLNQSGVSTELHVFPGAYHGFEIFAWNAPLSILARDTHFAALSHAFAPFPCT